MASFILTYFCVTRCRPFRRGERIKKDNDEQTFVQKAGWKRMARYHVILGYKQTSRLPVKLTFLIFSSLPRGNVCICFIRARENIYIFCQLLSYNT